MGLSQVNQLFDLMELFNQVPSSSTEEMVKDQKAVDSNYLSRGERILTLLREKIKTNPKRFKENSFFESLNFKTYSSYDDEKKTWVCITQDERGYTSYYQSLVGG